MKITTRTIMKIMRLYGVADDNASLREIRRLDVRDHESYMQALFIFNKQRRALLFGSVVDEDDIDEFWPDKPANAELLKNPLDPLTHTTPFQGKYLLFFNIPSTTQRLDTYLAQDFDPSRSRSQWQKHIKAGHVLVNSAPVFSPKTDISLEDKIEIIIPENTGDIHDLTVLYQDEDVMVINKPPGILTHAKGGISREQTIADFLRPHTTFGLDTDRAGIVHRLDRDTSGVIIGGRTPEAALFLQKQFADRRAKKTYLAIVKGRPKLDEATIDLPIARNPSKPSTFRVDPNGKPAQTTYKVLATDSEYSLIRLHPKTGRTHQLRVHLSYIGTPIIGDRVYGEAGERMMLHAYQLTIELPSWQQKTFTAPVPPEFAANFPNLTTDDL